MRKSSLPKNSHSNRSETGLHESFRTSENFFQQLVESLDEYAIFTTDKEGNISSWNAGAQRVLGYVEDEIIGKNISILYTEEDVQKKQHLKKINKAKKTGKGSAERWHVHKDGSLIWSQGNVFPLYDDLHQIRGFTFILRDLTEQQKAERTEKKFQSILENSSDGVRMIDKNGNIVYASPSTQKILGYSPKEYINQNILELIHPDDRNGYKKVIQKALNSPPSKVVEYTYRIKHKNGEYRWMEGVGTNLLSEPSVQALVSNFRDITERKNVQEERDRILAEFKAVIEQMPAGVIIAEAPNGRIVLSNQQAAKMSRYQNIEAKEFSEYKKFRRFHQDGREYKPKEWPMARAILKGEVVKNEEIKILRGDNSYAYISVSAAPVRNQKGEIIAGVSAFIDTTERREMEKRKDEFISMASHELKTPITSLNLFVDLLKKQISENKFERVVTIADKVKDQTNKLTELVSNLLDVSRIETGKMNFNMEKFNLHDLMIEIIEDLQQTTNGHTIICKTQKDFMVFADRFRIYQVLTNLLTNAIKYSPDSGTITLNSEKKGNEITVCVKDQGIGIDKDQQDRIFEKLYQVGNSTFPGLGMGLYISKEIVKRHNGKIWVESKPGNGSTFYFTLPLK